MKSYIINEIQLRAIANNLLNETPEVVYNFEYPDVNYRKIFFNGAKQYREKEGEYGDDTNTIKFVNKSGQEFVFDKNDVKFSVSPYYTPYVSLNKFNEKYGKKNDTNVTISEDQIKQTYKEAVFEALKKLFSESQNWDAISGRGPSKRGGVVNLYQVGEYAKEIGLENFEGGDWSIMNYFDTNPKVREEIIQKYKTDNNISVISDLNNFKQWIIDNRDVLFGEGEFLNKIVQLNKRSYLSGLKNELRAFNFVKLFIGSKPSWSLSSLNLPGSPKDRAGVDFSLIEDGKEIRTFQAKPFSGFYINEYNGKKYYRVYSYNIENLKNLKVDYFVFASDGKDGAVIFSNEKGKFTIGKKDKSDYIEFEYAPKYYDPNF